MKESNHRLFIISGPGGVGKATIIREVLKYKELNLVRGLNVSTRVPRPSDKQDPHFKFVEKNEFEKMIRKGEVLEYNYLDKEYYGTLGPSLSKQLKKHNVLMEVDVNGALEIKKKMAETVLIFLTANFKFLKKRMMKRKDTSKEHIEYRLNLAKKEMEKAKGYDYIVENPEGHPEKAVKEVLVIIKKELHKS